MKIQLTKDSLRIVPDDDIRDEAFIERVLGLSLEGDWTCLEYHEQGDSFYLETRKIPGTAKKGER